MLKGRGFLRRGCKKLARILRISKESKEEKARREAENQKALKRHVDAEKELNAAKFECEQKGIELSTKQYISRGEAKGESRRRFLMGAGTVLVGETLLKAFGPVTKEKEIIDDREHNKSTEIIIPLAKSHFNPILKIATVVSNGPENHFVDETVAAKYADSQITILRWGNKVLTKQNIDWTIPVKITWALSYDKIVDSPTFRKNFIKIDKTKKTMTMSTAPLEVMDSEFDFEGAKDNLHNKGFFVNQGVLVDNDGQFYADELAIAQKDSKEKIKKNFSLPISPWSVEAPYYERAKQKSNESMQDFKNMIFSIVIGVGGEEYKDYKAELKEMTIEQYNAYVAEANSERAKKGKTAQ